MTDSLFKIVETYFAEITQSSAASPFVKSSCLDKLNNLKQKRESLISLQNKLTESVELPTKLKLSIGGKYMEINQDVVEKHCNGKLFFRILSQKFNHLLLKDRNGNIFLDLDKNLVILILNYARDLSLWNGDEMTKPNVAAISPELIDNFSAFGSFFGLFSEHNLFGQNSSILLNEIGNNTVQTSKWLSDCVSQAISSKHCTASLLYQGSRDGFGSKTFHSRCDNIINTLTIAKDSDGNIFGGFGDCVWNLDGQNHLYKNSAKSFLFSLKHDNIVRNFQYNLIESSGFDKAQFSSNVSLPSFGCDKSSVILFIRAKNINDPLTSYCKLLKTCYIVPPGAPERLTTPKMDDESRNQKPFELIDIEVYKILPYFPTSKDVNFEISSGSAPVEADFSNNILLNPTVNSENNTLLNDELNMLSLLQTKMSHFSNLLSQLDAIIEKQAVDFLSDLHSVLRYIHLTPPNWSPRNNKLSDFENNLSEISSIIERMTFPPEQAKIVYINCSGTKIAVSHPTLLQAPVGSPLYNMTSDVWGHTTDNEGNIVQDVNPDLFLIIINYLRLKALLPPIDMPPIVVHEHQFNALCNLLDFYMLSELPIETIKCEVVVSRKRKVDSVL